MAACCKFRSGGQPRRWARFVSWIVPGTVLVVMPKCPACLAAYIALGTGIGLTLPTAEYMRVGGLVLSGAVLVLLAFRTLHRIGRRWFVP